tara:strand:+ start:36 stop:614 length:579 start_codon:yes stop_codon:yes gene_type:complete
MKNKNLNKFSNDDGLRYLPGDLDLKEKIQRIIRVNQAGEYGAKRIYAGQLAVLRKKPISKELVEMAEQEEKHLNSFNKLMIERKIRPTALQPLWHFAGYALGMGTALMGEKAAMACTVAVEEAIDEHYENQSHSLGNNEPEIKKIITEAREDEIKHLEKAEDHGGKEDKIHLPLRLAIKKGTKIAIWLSERI